MQSLMQSTLQQEKFHRRSVLLKQYQSLSARLQALDGFVEVNEGRADGRSEAVIPQHLLAQHLHAARAACGNEACVVARAIRHLYYKM